MPAYQDPGTGKWFCKFYYTDYTGEKRQKKKRGFIRKKDAQEWEREFLSKHAGDPNMRFGTFSELYFEDMSHRLKESTIYTKRNMFDNRIIPFFREMRLNEIKATDIRRWQNSLCEYTDKNGSPLKPTYIKELNDQMTAIMNYAVNFYDLKENPCNKAGKVGEGTPDEMEFWTDVEFNSFIKCVKSPSGWMAFMLLYYTGMRIGEMLALTRSDIDFKSNFIKINKTLHRRNKKDIITSPKTKKSIRDISIPPFLSQYLEDYIKRIYRINPDHRIFFFTRGKLRYDMYKGCLDSGVKEIRLHDLRHSHVAYLIEIGIENIYLISERLGHDSVVTTLKTYGHLYPDKQNVIATKMQNQYQNSTAINF